MKKVSIIVTTYNGERYIREQLDSILDQTYPIYEIIIQDDGSKDGTWKILEDYRDKISNIKIYRNEEAHGVNGNVYSALKRATGDLIGICDQDDIWEPQKIEQQVNLIGDAMLIGGTTLPFSDDGSAVNVDTRPANCSALRLIFASAIPGHSMLLRPELLSCFTPNDFTCYDAQLQVAASVMDSLIYQGVCPVHQRRHVDASTYTPPTSNTRNASNAIGYILDCIKLYSRVRPIQKRRMLIWQHFLESMNVCTNNYNLAIKMTELMQYSNIIGLSNLLMFCYRNRQELFYTRENDTFILKIRSLLFPLLSVYYYRGLK